MSILKKHLGIGEILKVGDDEIMLKPLDVEWLPKFFKIMKAFSGAKEGSSTAEMMEHVDDEGLNAIRDVVAETIERSLPDESEEDRKQFGLKYMGQILGVVLKLNSANVESGDGRKAKMIDKIKEMKDKNAKSVSENTE